MAHLTKFSFELFYKIFTAEASLPLLHHGAKKSKMTKNSNQGGPALSCLTALAKARLEMPIVCATLNFTFMEERFDFSKFTILFL